MPHAFLWAGKANTCPGKEYICHFMGSVAFWQSGAGAAVQLSDMQHGISRSLSPSGGILLPLSLGLSDF